GQVGCSEGLELLSVVTELKPQKQVHNVTGTLRLNGQQLAVKGYEIHCGYTHKLRPGEAPLTWQRALAEEDSVSSLHRGDGLLVDDGVLSEDDQILGTYLHGLFDAPEATAAILRWAGCRSEQACINIDDLTEQQLNRLADVLAQHLDIKLLNSILATQQAYQEEAAG
ncbi:MAG: cobyric acid synthase CobQ, partial [Shewanella sp.]|nr:cobyric acid synthase CobQ [Shewanella sp.]